MSLWCKPVCLLYSQTSIATTVSNAYNARDRRPPASDKEQAWSLSDSSKGSYVSSMSTAPADLVDQVGYSSISRRNELERVGEVII